MVSSLSRFFNQRSQDELSINTTKQNLLWPQRFQDLGETIEIEIYHEVAEKQSVI